MVTDLQGNLRDANTALCTLFGYTKEELLRLNVRSLIDPEHLRDHPLMFDLLESGKHVFNERKMVHKKNKIIYVEANAKKCSDTLILVIAKDITERKITENILHKSEADLHTILNTTDTIYVLMDHGFRIMSYNMRAKSFAAKELGHEIEISEYLLDYFPAEKQAVLLHYLNAVLKGQHVNYEVNYPQPDGSLNWYHVKIFPISRGDDKVYGLMMAVSEITEKIILEEQLEEERIKKQLEITDAIIVASEKERHSIGIELHDNVNQLLAAARIYLGVLKKTNESRKGALIEKTDNLIENVIDEIRNLSHSLISPCLKQGGLIESLDHLLETLSNGHMLNVRKELATVEEGSMTDKLKLTIFRIVQEQVHNISKHAFAKNIDLSIVQETGRILLLVKDDGIGFDTGKKITGIGLENIRMRASLFKGEVDIISSPGNGFQLMVSLSMDRTS